MLSNPFVDAVDALLDMFIKDFAYDKVMKYFWWIYKKLYANADNIFVLSPNAIDRDSILKNNRGKIVVIPYGINTEISSVIIEKRYINGIDIFGDGMFFVDWY